MATLGRKVAAKATVMNVGSGASTPELAATVFGPVPVDCWVTAFGAWVGHRGTGGQALLLGAFTVADDGTPDRWLGERSFTPTVELSATGAGQNVENRQTSVGTGLANQGLPLAAGERIAVFVFSTAAVAISRGAVAGASVLTRDGLAARPDPFGEATIIADAALDLYIEYVPNAAPLVPYWFLRDKLSSGNHFLTPFQNPSAHPAVWGGEPAVNFDKFDTVDEQHGDEIGSVELDVATAPDSGSVVVQQTLTKGELYPILDTGGSDPSYELMASYRGPKLAPGVYFMRARFRDHHGLASEWTPWLQEGGDGAWAAWVDRDSWLLDASPGTTPVDRIETTNPTEFRAILAARSTVGATAAHLLVSQVIDGVIAKVVLSEVVALTAAPGAALVVPWNGAWANLAAGSEFAYRIRPIHQPAAPNDARRYVGNAPEWVRFRTNAPPSVPADLDPNSSAGTDAFPLLTATVTDADDTPATGLGVQFRITRPNASVVTVNATLRAGTTDVWDYQTTAAEFNAAGTYSWDAQASDGIATSAFSAAATVVFGALPVVAITAPAAGSNQAANFNVTWTVSGGTQTHKRVTLTDLVSGTVVYDSGLLASATLSQTVSLATALHDRDHLIAVEATITNGLVGEATRTIHVLYSLPATPTGLTAAPHTYAGEPEATAVLLDWASSAEPNFLHYRVTKQALAGDHETAEETIAELTTIGTSTYTYALPASGVPYRYRVYTVKSQGGGTVPSAAASVDHTVSFESLVLVAVGFGATDRAVLPYVASRDVDRTKDEELVIPWSEDKPLVFEGEANYQAVAATIDLADPATVAADMAALRRIDTNRATVCYRDDRGRKLFGATRLRETDEELTRQTAALTVTENNWREGG